MSIAFALVTRYLLQNFLSIDIMQEIRNFSLVGVSYLSFFTIFRQIIKLSLEINVDNNDTSLMKGDNAGEGSSKQPETSSGKKRKSIDSGENEPSPKKRKTSPDSDSSYSNFHGVRHQSLPDSNFNDNDENNDNNDTGDNEGPSYVPLEDPVNSPYFQQYMATWTNVSTDDPSIPQLAAVYDEARYKSIQYSNYRERADSSIPDHGFGGP